MSLHSSFFAFHNSVTVLFTYQTNKHTVTSYYNSQMPSYRSPSLSLPNPMCMSLSTLSPPLAVILSACPPLSHSLSFSRLSTPQIPCLSSSTLSSYQSRLC
ncbi:Hypothetical predicted protein [Octopus vulgaris]|uniref:Uncharacterized protein n=1 Tax=Octopus vulgaris TaxID=6645 RepID=A0AA36FDR3_OCTVU|nr:Hypothetical predicted protein [Octopus vulgaris]